MAIKLKIGPPVIGEDFFGRWNELKKAEVLIQDNNLMLAAPRRVGKTSFARRLKDVQSAKGWNTIFIDLEEINSVTHFFRAFHNELMKLPEASLTDKVKTKMKKWLSGIEMSTNGLPVKAMVKYGTSENDDFKELAEVLNTLDNHTLVVFDELTVLLESLSEANGGEREVKTFMNQFRALRTATTASVGIKISVDATNYLLRKIGWNIPFFIQLIVSRLPVGKVSKANIDEAYNKLLQTGSFDTWYERLSKEYGRNKDIAKLVLKYLCVCTEGKKRDDIFNHIYAKYPSFESDDMGLLLRALMNDGYLVKDREQYRFRSPLLRDYWKETYC